MRKLMGLLAVAVTAAIAPTQAGAHHTTQHTLNQTRAKLNALHTFVHTCLAWRVVPITQYGTPEAEGENATGYLYDFGPENGLATALDFPERPEDTLFVVAAVRQRPACLRSVGRSLAFASRTSERSPLARKAQRFG